jgi:drug/metabolite transporter (DMT)-like permease
MAAAGMTARARPSPAVAYALASAALFGVSTPLAKVLLGDVSPLMLAGLLYAGSGAGLTLWRLVRPAPGAGALIERGQWPWLAGAILAGGVVAPVCLMLGLARTPATTTSLLLNLEGVFTTGLAWFLFREHFDRRIATGMALILAGSVALTWTGGALTLQAGSVLIALACAGWGLDNNLTQKVSHADAARLAALKGFVAALVNVSLATWLGHAWPAQGVIAMAMAVGFAGYGLSLVLFVVALRHLGTARTGAYFSTAPFIGALVSIAWLREPVSALLLPATALMAAGVYLHLTERHGHAHAHEAMAHSHRHAHDAHHQHAHAPGVDPRAPHTHWHEHAPLTHTHPHYPDIHHRHDHG